MRRWQLIIIGTIHVALGIREFLVAQTLQGQASSSIVAVEAHAHQAVGSWGLLGLWAVGTMLLLRAWWVSSLPVLASTTESVPRPRFPAAPRAVQRRQR